ncbi:hypothetical protein EMIHUDRAFT_242868 [Emiliania huxleyi CCMP1516]|uniref:RING-type E3 ubiquitin transferase n=2 Tax=Emiliania huxleyi TaxID=2903 RepID=A0A0D3J795_EMIH1|nr:hypothetical protein EMIHUDRAFT_242868 [Emiliania huxleyi CCMP1516]EOD19380.1 hypothetical protein EMIHUDRAFT_242868 [Emiliania huxleyi CCMP1516]|eukprot:XP_005771809.1 hypothetical protein EMIHUDRAFT_242868 [Emiliania huxleyi CCMP1516]
MAAPAGHPEVVASHPEKVTGDSEAVAAARRGDVAAVRLWLERGAPDTRRRTPSQSAVATVTRPPGAAAAPGSQSGLEQAGAAASQAGDEEGCPGLGPGRGDTPPALAVDTAAVDKVVPPELLEQLQCPLSLDFMSDPVMAASGQTYERAAIEKWLAMGKRTDPMSGQQLEHTDLVPNVLVRSLCRTFALS